MNIDGREKQEDYNNKWIGEFFSILKLKFPINCFPTQKIWQQSLKYLNSKQPDTSATAALQFIKHVHKQRITWDKCTWNKVLYPLDADTLILPYMLFECGYLRYYFPSFLFTVCLEIDRVESANLEGGSSLFVYAFLQALNAHVHILSIQEKDATIGLLQVINDVFLGSIDDELILDYLTNLMIKLIVEKKE